MCGIFGLVKTPKDSVFVDDLSDSLRNLAHRGSDNSGIYCHQNIGLGHQRLAIFDTSEQGKQPMTAWGATITFNGAIYNFPELRKELSDFGYTFSSQTDTEVILAAYHRWGKDCVKKFNGQWAFAIHDTRKNILFCSRDRFGIKPFYYTWIKGRFYFASEIKAFLAIKGWKAILNQTRAIEYLVHQMHDHCNETFFKGVLSLEKGHHLIIDLQNQGLRKEAYYDLDDLKPIKLSEPEALTQFKQLFERSIRLRLRTDVPLGSALSGGLDSSALVLSIPKIANLSPINTFSIVYDQPSISEKKYLDSVLAQGTFQASSLSPSLSSFQEQEAQILWHQEEPFNGFGVHAQHLLFKSASEKGIKVMLDGQGADEILGGYEKFYYSQLKSSIHNPLSFLKLLYQIHTKHHLNYTAIIKQFWKYKSKNKSSLPNWINASYDLEQGFKRKTESSMLDISKNLIYGLGLGALLRYEDKNAMAFGIESRVPFLDHHLVEFCLGLPDDFKIRAGVRKWILRESIKDRLPKTIYQRYDKLGFATPQNLWLEQERSNYLQEIKIHFSKLDRIISPNYKHLDTLTLWRINMLRKWIDKFNVAII